VLSARALAYGELPGGENKPKEITTMLQQTDCSTYSAPSLSYVNELAPVARRARAKYRKRGFEKLNAFALPELTTVPYGEGSFDAELLSSQRFSVAAAARVKRQKGCE
jgi:hypothetical protein